MPKKPKVTKTVNNSQWHEKTHDNGIAEYVSGDAIGTVQSIQVLGSGGGGTIRVINAWNNIENTLALRIWFFRRQPRAVTDNAPFVMHENDLQKLAGYRDIPAGLYIANGKIRVAHLANANMDYSCPDGRLYYVVQAQATATYSAANRLKYNFGDWPD